MANSNQSVSIYVYPLDTEHEKINIKIIRKIENYLLNKYFTK
jgi:hypothetical protein